MQEDILKLIQDALSEKRYNAYKNLFAAPNQTAPLANYLWNISLSRSLYPALQTLEVVLRNTLHRTIQQFCAQSYWFTKKGLLDTVEAKIVNEKIGILWKKDRANDPDHIVSELSFGFWTNLLDKRYEGKFWPKLLKQAFPYVPKHLRTRDTIAKNFNQIRRLRNRIFHHQRIWHLNSLPEQHEKILKAIGWITPEVRNFISSIDDFKEIYYLGSAIYQDKIIQLLPKKLESIIITS